MFCIFLWYINKLVAFSSYFIIRFIVNFVSFPGNNIAFRKQTEIDIYRVVLTQFIQKCDELKNVVESIKRNPRPFFYLTHLKIIISDFTIFLDCLNIKNKNSLKFQQLIKNIQNILKILKQWKLEDKSTKQWIYFENLLKMEKDSLKSYDEYEFDHSCIDELIKNSSESINHLKNLIQFTKTWKFLFFCIYNNLHFDSMYYLRKSMERDFLGKYFKLKTEFGNVEGLIILNSKFFTSDQSSKFLDRLIKRFYLFDNSDTLELENLLIISEPNAGRYELHQLDQSLIKNFQQKGFNIVAWNYAGYNKEDRNLCTLESVTQNLSYLINIFRKNIKINKLILYGKSMGGFATVQNVSLADDVIIDRTFWNISLIPRKNFNKTIQIIFDLFINNFYHFDEILKCKGKICIIYDPNDSIIPLNCSAFMGVFYLLSKYFFNAKKGLHQDKFKKDYYNYISDIKFCLKQTEKQIQQHLKLEQFLNNFVNSNSLKTVFEAFTNIFSIYFYNKSSLRQINPLLTTNEENTIWIEDIQNFIKNNPTNQIILDKKELNHQYWESIVTIFDSDYELKKFMLNLQTNLNAINVCTLSLFNIFSQKKQNYENFIMFLWICFLQENRFRKDDEKLEIYDSKRIKNAILRIEELICKLFASKDRISHKINPFNNFSTVKFFNDLIIILNFLKEYFGNLKKKSLEELKVEIKFDSEDEIDSVSQDQPHLLRDEIDFVKIIEIMQKFVFVKVHSGHNSRLSKSVLQSCLKKLNN